MLEQSISETGRYQILADSLPQMVWVMSCKDGSATYTNAQFRAYYGPISPERIERTSRNHPDDAERMAQTWHHSITTRQTFTVEGRLRRHDGVYRWHKLVMIPVERHGQIVEWLGTALDIDDIVEARNRLVETSGLLHLAQESAGAGIWDWAIGETTIRCSPASAGMHHHPVPAGIDDHATVPVSLEEWWRSVHVDDLQGVREKLYAAIDSHKIFEAQYRTVDPDNIRALRWVSVSGQVVYEVGSGEPLRVVGLHFDITDRHDAEARIQHMAMHDSLTGLPNRNLFRDRLSALCQAHTGRGRFAVVCLDLDDFKQINDTMGHPAGDRLLQETAERLRSAVRDDDLVARLGGDEFVILLAEAGTDTELASFAQRLITLMDRPVELGERLRPAGISVGIAVGQSGFPDPDMMFRNADIALYKAKQAGRNTYRLFEPGMEAELLSRQHLETDLRQALERGELYLHYQPILDMKQDGVAGFEALLRWDSPGRGKVSPIEFIGLAEETGLIVPIGRWVLNEACRTVAAWPGNPRIAVNVSAIQFRHPGFEESVLEAIEASGLAPGRLELEVTESVLMADDPEIPAILRRLRGLGVRIALDDFGTGYSSLSYLRQFPFDKMKLDRSFIEDLEEPQTIAIVDTLIGLAGKLGITVTAEGVETPRQLEALRQGGCHEVQGFWFGRPMMADQARGFMSERLKGS